METKIKRQKIVADGRKSVKKKLIKLKTKNEKQPKTSPFVAL